MAKVPLFSSQSRQRNDRDPCGTALPTAVHIFFANYSAPCGSAGACWIVTYEPLRRAIRRNEKSTKIERSVFSLPDRSAGHAETHNGETGRKHATYLRHRT